MNKVEERKLLHQEIDDALQGEDLGVIMTCLVQHVARTLVRLSTDDPPEAPIRTVYTERVEHGIPLITEQLTKEVTRALAVEEKNGTLIAIRPPRKKKEETAEASGTGDDEDEDEDEDDEKGLTEAKAMARLLGRLLGVKAHVLSTKEFEALKRGEEG